ncbi:MAG: hypothetical protein Tsb0013_08340 [Phycisphaerales bacterium]
MLASMTRQRSASSPEPHGDADALSRLSRVIGRRPTRVGLLIIACVLMGLTDLACTLAYVGGIGMVELNPLARYVIEHGGASWLIAFKLVTMLVTGLCVYLSRHHRMGEQCAWLSFLLLMALTLHWVRYNEEIVSPETASEITMIAATPESDMITHWVRFRD